MASVSSNQLGVSQNSVRIGPYEVPLGQVVSAEMEPNSNVRVWTLGGMGYHKEKSVSILFKCETTEKANAVLTALLKMAGPSLGLLKAKVDAKDAAFYTVSPGDVTLGVPFRKPLSEKSPNTGAVDQENDLKQEPLSELTDERRGELLAVLERGRLFWIAQELNMLIGGYDQYLVTLQSHAREDMNKLDYHIILNLINSLPNLKQEESKKPK